MAQNDMYEEEMLDQLVLEEKVALLSGSDNWHTTPIARLKVPALRLSDGPNGIRGIHIFAGEPAACFPAATGMASTFDLDLVQRIGEAMGKEARSKGVHVVLGPTCNIQRDLRGGRGFESFSEDPTLSGLCGVAIIQGIQAQKVAATPKHFLCNDHETLRNRMDIKVDERALREIYLRPFELMVKRAKPEAVMTSYNRVNGLHLGNNAHLLNDVLRKEWGFDGLTMSDWHGSASNTDMVDLEMPGPTTVRGAALLRAVKCGLVTEAEIDERATRVLALAHKAIDSGIPFDAPEHQLDTSEVRALQRQAAADSIVLLKNDGNLLPLPTEGIKRILVVGSNAAIAAYSGGGSARLFPTRAITPLHGLQEACNALAIEIEHQVGAYGHRYLPEFPLRSPSGKEGVYKVSFFGSEADKEAITSLESRQYDLNFDDMDASVPRRCFALLEADFEVDQAGEWEFGLATWGTAKLFIDGELLVDNSKSQRRGDLFFGNASEEERSLIHLDAGHTYRLSIRFHSPAPKLYQDLQPRGGFRFGGCPIVKPQEGIATAVEAARNADAIICCVGTTWEHEGEAFDRKTLELPKATNDLITALLDVGGKRTAIVIQSGTLVTPLPWLDRAPAVMQAWYGGGELGHAIADVLFGRVEPSGRLSLSWPKELGDQTTAHRGGEKAFPGIDGVVHYEEALDVGYRFFDRQEAPEPLFAFGHGLSYTTFKYGELQLAKEMSDEGTVELRIQIENDGQRAGREVVQIYVSALGSAVPRPFKELRSFSKTRILAPGETQDLHFSLDREAWAYWCTKQHTWRATKGRYAILAASSSSGQAARQSSVEVVVKEELSWT